MFNKYRKCMFIEHDARVSKICSQFIMIHWELKYNGSTVIFFLLIKKLCREGLCNLHLDYLSKSVLEEIVDIFSSYPKLLEWHVCYPWKPDTKYDTMWLGSNFKLDSPLAPFWLMNLRNSCFINSGEIIRIKHSLIFHTLYTHI